MGYRIRLGKVPKNEFTETMRNKTFEELQAYYEDLLDAVYRPEYHTELYEIGKYVSYEEGREPFYLNFDVEKETECEFDILSKEGLKNIIVKYKESTKEYYRKLFEVAKHISKNKTIRIKKKSYQDFDFNSILSELMSKCSEWNDSYYDRFLGNLDEPEEKLDGVMTSSWSIEYAIFNLIYIYRTFDFENNYLIYSGW